MFNAAIDRFTCTASARKCVFRLIAMWGRPTSLAACWSLSNVASTNANDGRMEPSINFGRKQHQVNQRAVTCRYIQHQQHQCNIQSQVAICQSTFQRPVSISPTTSRESPTLEGGDPNSGVPLDGLKGQVGGSSTSRQPRHMGFPRFLRNPYVSN